MVCWLHNPAYPSSDFDESASSLTLSRRSNALKKSRRVFPNASILRLFHAIRILALFSAAQLVDKNCHVVDENAPPTVTSARNSPILPPEHCEQCMKLISVNVSFIASTNVESTARKNMNVTPNVKGSVGSSVRIAHAGNLARSHAHLACNPATGCACIMSVLFHVARCAIFSIHDMQLIGFRSVLVFPAIYHVLRSCSAVTHVPRVCMK